MKDSQWVSVWGNAISIADRKPENYARNLTLRYPVRNAFDGTSIRLTFSNFYGHEPVSIRRVTVAPSEGNRELTGQPVDVTFGGNRSAVVPSGAELTSDAVSYPAKAGEWLTVSFYLEDFTEMRSGVLITGPLSRGFYSIGDQTCSAALPLDNTRNTSWVYFLSRVDVLTDSSRQALVCYGDSITSQAWPDYLALRCLERPDNHVSIVRRAASGTRVLRQYDNITYDSYGIKGATRFPHELPVPGCRNLIIQHGINDIIHPVGVEVNPFRPWSDLPTAEQLIDGLEFYLKSAHNMGMKVWLGTLLPIEGWRTYAPFREELRNAVNDWMRTTPDADGCIDFDLAVRNPENPSAFAPGFDSGDHLHPSQKAYQAMAEAVPEQLLIP